MKTKPRRSSLPAASFGLSGRSESRGGLFGDFSSSSHTVSLRVGGFEEKKACGPLSPCASILDSKLLMFSQVGTFPSRLHVIVKG